MKNFKNMTAALSLMAVLGFGAVSANAGLIISDRSANGVETQCTQEQGIVRDIAGVVAAGASMFDGIIIIGREGLIISDRTNCSTTSRDGIIISD